ncbi:MAG TPA: hypothetical protein VFO45_01125 [Sphingomicrobium sp.]|nr:hypothetical protein [Sphingomicrobium sp.]
MTALRRMVVSKLGWLAAALALATGTPALAQDNDAPVDVTAAPPPSAETIGPSQLRDFNLQGTVTRPADRPATTPAQPANTAAAAPRSGEAVPSEAAATPAPSAAVTPRGLARSQSASGSPTDSSAISASSQPVTPSLPLEVTTGAAPQPGFSDDSTPASDSVDPGSRSLQLPWIAALLALVAGGAFIVWTRRGRRQRYADQGRMAFAGLAPEIAGDSKPFPPARPRPDPLPPRAQPAPRPDPVPPRPAPEADAGLIVSTRLKPQLNVEFIPDRVMVTDQEIMLQFEIVIANVGSAPARDVLVEGRLFTAHVGQDQEIAAFFQNPDSHGDRMASIAPLGRISLKSVARLPLDQVYRFEAGGRKMFVPLVGFNILYRFGSGDGHASASFLVGRGNEADEKLAPFRIDLGPRIFRGLSSRPHSIGLQTA